MFGSLILLTSPAKVFFLLQIHFSCNLPTSLGEQNLAQILFLVKKKNLCGCLPTSGMLKPDATIGWRFS